MRRGVNLTVALILIALFIKVIALSNKTIAGTEVTSGIHGEMSIYGLHAAYPNMKDLPVQEAPQP